MSTPDHTEPQKLHISFKSKKADGRHLEKLQKSPYLSNGSTDLDEIWQDYAHWASEAYQLLRILICENLRRRHPPF